MTQLAEMGLLRPLARAGNALLDLVYPPSCLVCRRAVATQGAICPECWRDIAFIERPFCERLGTPFERDLAQPGLISLEAAANPPAFGRARAVARYDSDKGQEA
jgi:predicted amidophosphoribosyltransferase